MNAVVASNPLPARGHDVGETAGPLARPSAQCPREVLSFFNALEADHLVLEFARRGDDELEVFKDLKPGIALGVGVIDIKDNEVETPDEIAQRIEHAVRVIGAERVQWVHPDCGFWMLHRSVADRKMRALVRGRNLFEGRDE